MAEKIYFYLFILCAIFSPETVGDLFDVGKSISLIRKRRVLNFEPGGDVPVRSGVAPFVVEIKEHPNNYAICVGSILSIRTVITSAPCVARSTHEYLIIVSSSTVKSGGISHQVVKKKVHLGNHPRRADDGVALLIIQRVFQFDLNTYRIPLHEEPLLPQSDATIFGWGCNPTLPRGTNHIARLRAITVPIMHQRDCVNSYRNQVEITDKDICTFHENKRCGHIDGGAPLVVNNSLAGVYLFSVQRQGRFGPDVFIDIQNLAYSPWIRNNIVYL